MNQPRHVHCPICGLSPADVILTIEQPDRFEKAAGIGEAGYRRWWVECQGCGLLIDVLTRPDLAAIYLDSYYSPAVEQETPAERYARIMALPRDRSDNALRVKRIRRFLDEIEESVPPNTERTRRVLDIGAGTGVFLSRFLEDLPHWQGAAIEPNQAACEHLRSLGRFEVVEGCFPEAAPASPHDLVTLNKVLEHLPDPLDILRRLPAVMTENGLAYVEVPDKLTAWMRPPTDNILGSLHYYLFDPVTLTKLLERAGFSTLWLRRYVEPSGKITVSALAATTDSFKRQTGAHG